MRRPLVGFALIGGLLFGGRRLLWPVEPERAPLAVVVPSGASASEIDRATDEAILLAFAIRAGFVERDPAVRDRLVRNVQFADANLAEEEALARALDLDMHRTDPVARQRLIQLAEETLASATRAAPTDAELQDYLRAHPERFRREPTVSFEQVFVSRKRADFDERVRDVAAGPSVALSDPGLLPSEMKHASAARMDGRFGTGFGAAVLALEPGSWSAPIRTAFGVHFVRVSERSAGALPSLEPIRARVLHEHERDARGERVRRALSRMRAAYVIQVEERS